MSIIEKFTDERPSFRTIAASRRNGWTPARVRANWPDDEAMIPRSIRLYPVSELLIGTQRGTSGMAVESWRKAGGIHRDTTGFVGIPTNPVGIGEQTHIGGYRTRRRVRRQP